MIIWLASYPKSGNTWLRFFLISLFFSGKKVNLNHLKHIISFPSKSHFSNLIDDLLDIKKISRNWETSQNIINKEKKIKIFKTHNMLCRFGNNYFTNIKNTMGAVHIVRDPRNVITSIKNHYNLDSLNIAKQFLFNEKNIITMSEKQKEKYITHNEYPLPTVLGSWKTHYLSWKNMKKNYLLVKYENLIQNPLEEFRKISKYFSQILSLEFTNDQIEEAVKLSSFEKLKKMEENYGFTESSYNNITGEKNTFFNLGPKNDWTKILDKDIADEISAKFEPEMKELEYLSK
tara:strand:- start:33 stop:899 length:867 start_codon:yes stop_codon:yes gene_type:complete